MLTGTLSLGPSAEQATGITMLRAAEVRRAIRMTALSALESCPLHQAASARASP
jgi:hypothetical protein